MASGSLSLRDEWVPGDSRVADVEEGPAVGHRPVGPPKDLSRGGVGVVVSRGLRGGGVARGAGRRDAASVGAQVGPRVGLHVTHTSTGCRGSSS